MTFVKKTWTDRIAEYITRRKLTNVSTGATEIVTVERSEGEISQEGDAFSATNMNDLEQRIADEFSELNSSITAISERISKMGMKVLKYGTISATTTIQLGVTLDPSKYTVRINTNAYASGPSTGEFLSYSGSSGGAGMYYKGYGWSSSYGDGAYLSAKTSTSCTITVSSGITASYEIIQIAE